MSLTISKSLVYDFRGIVMRNRKFLYLNIKLDMYKVK